MTTATVGGVFGRLWWFLTGIVAGWVITIRALRRRPGLGELASAGAVTLADVLEGTARLVRPNRGR